MIGATLQQGTVTASLRLRKLGSYLHHNGMAMALRELGSIERTLFILDWLQSIELRRRIQARLNKDEARNEHQSRPAVIEMAAGDTTVGFTPFCVPQTNCTACWNSTRICFRRKSLT